MMRKYKILLIHNKYLKYGGEEAVVESQIKMLKKNNHEVITYFRESKDIGKMSFGKSQSFLLALYNRKSIVEIKKLIEKELPDVVHIHNLYPLISPAILPVIKKRRIPIVMTVHNYRLLCPNGLFFSNNEICEKCNNGMREFNCIVNNCEGSIFKSVGYATRNFWARKNKFYIKNIDNFLCLTEFQKNKLITNGFSSAKCKVIPNIYNQEIENIDYNINDRKYVAYAGRISPEKGISFLLRAAKKLPNIEFRLAGKISGDYLDELDIPKNVILVGLLNPEELSRFYREARCFVLSSICYEGFPMVFPEAMAHKLPIIAPNMAGFTEVVEENINGFLFEPGNIASLTNAIVKIWNNTELATKMAENNFKKAKIVYTSEVYYNQLEEVYQFLLHK